MPPRHHHHCNHTSDGRPSKKRKAGHFVSNPLTAPPPTPGARTPGSPPLCVKTRRTNLKTTILLCHRILDADKMPQLRSVSRLATSEKSTTRTRLEHCHHDASSHRKLAPRHKFAQNTVTTTSLRKGNCHRDTHSHRIVSPQQKHHQGNCHHESNSNRKLPPRHTFVQDNWHQDANSNKKLSPRHNHRCNRTNDDKPLQTT